MFAKVYQHVDFGGQYRWITKNVRNMSSELGFNDKVSSIVVYKGNDYKEGETMRFYQHANYGGGYIDLGPGIYRSIHSAPYFFGDKISSVKMISPVALCPPITVRLIVRVYQHVNFEGQYRDLPLTERNLKLQGFNDTISSLQIFEGEDYQAGWVANFYKDANGYGPQLQDGDFGPGTRIANIKAKPYSFNDQISSIRIERL